MLSPTFRGDRDGRNKPSLDHGRLQAALFAAAASAMGGTGHGVAADEIPPTSFPARVPSDDDDEAPAAPAATGESAAKAPSRRGRAPAVGAAESPTAPFLEHQRGGGDGLGGTVSSSSEGVSSTEAAAAAEEEEAGDDPDWESGNGSRSGGGGVPLLRLSLRAQREFVAVAAAASSSPPLPPPPRNARQRRAPAMATLTDEGIAFATKGGARAGARRSSSSPPPPSPPPSRWSRTLLLPPLLPFSEIVGAEALPRSGGASSSSSSSPSSLASFLRNCTASSPQREPWLVRVHTVSKGSKLGDWKPRAVSLLAPSPHAARTWASSISASSHAGRPRSLLVLLNPYGGAKGAARRVWRRVAQPLLEGVARIRCEVLETDSAGHAERAVRGLGLERLRSLDGIVVVGGDGLFQEALNGLLAIRFGGGGGGCGGGGEEEGGADGEVAASAAAAAADSTPTASSLRSLEASRLRLGHIPAGSTDALAWSVHGTRCPAAAALHVALGDGARLDVLALGPVPRGLLHVEKGGAAAAAPPPPPPRSSIAEEEKESSSGGGGGVGSRDEAAEADDAAGRSPLTPRGAPTSSGGGSNGTGAGESSSSAAAPVAPPSPPRLGTSSSPPDTEWPPRAAACMASCGYFGDLLALSEKMRWLGPARYGVAGFLTLAFLKRYDLRILYLPAETEGEGADERGSAPETPRTPAAWPLLPGAVGRAFACQQPASGAAATAAAAAASSSPRSSPSITCPATEWKTVEGSFSAVLLACLPCRSDRSASGIAPDRAMADGLASLVRVRACSRLQFLRFLVAVSKDGARVVEEAAAAVSCSGGAGGGAGGGEGEGKGPIGRERGGGGGAAALPWVSVVAVRAVAVEPLSPPSPSSASSPKNYLPWNADGETLPPAGVAAVVRKGLVRVFARPQLDDDE